MLFRSRRALQDVVTAIRLKCTVEELGFHRFASAERHLKTPEEMHRLFRRHPHALERIQEIVCERFSVTMDQLTGDRRSQNIVYPRQVAMYLSRELTDSSLPKIGKEFGGRDHTTVIHATSKIARKIREDRSVYNLVQELTARIKHAH